MLGLELVKVEHLGHEGSGIATCGSNDACSSSVAGTFCYEHACADCAECEHCWDGADGTCGECGAGYPTKESIDCTKVNETDPPDRTKEDQCEEHSDCSSKHLPFCYVGMCEVCSECQYCSDGIDGTCGSCGNGHLLEESACTSSLAGWGWLAGLLG